MSESSKEFAYSENLQPKKPTGTEIEFKIKTTQESIESKERQMAQGNEATRKAIKIQIENLKGKLGELEIEKNRFERSK